MLQSTLRGAIFVATTIAFFNVSAFAQPANFTIDSSRSQVQVSGSIIGLPLQEQGPGSLAARFQGTIRADVAAASITFPGGSAIDALTNGVWAPNVGGGSGTAPADFAGKANSIFGAAQGAVRNVILDLTSVSLPLAGSNFDASGLAFSFPASSSASLDYSSAIKNGSMALAGLSASNIVSGASLSTSNGVQTLTIQVDTEYRFKLFSDNDSSLRLVGQIVATQGAGPQLVAPRFSNGQLTFDVVGANGTAQIQSSTDLKTWAPKTVTPTVTGDHSTYTVPTSGILEFFRLAQ